MEVGWAKQERQPRRGCSLRTGNSSFSFNMTLASHFGSKPFPASRLPPRCVSDGRFLWPRLPHSLWGGALRVPHHSPGNIYSALWIGFLFERPDPTRRGPNSNGLIESMAPNRGANVPNPHTSNGSTRVEMYPLASAQGAASAACPLPRRVVSSLIRVPVVTYCGGCR